MVDHRFSCDCNTIKLSRLINDFSLSLEQQSIYVHFIKSW